MSAKDLSASAPPFEPGVAWQQEAKATESATGQRLENEYIELLRGGYWSARYNWWVPYQVGTLKSFNMRTGYGFLESERAFAIYKTDVFIHMNQVARPWKIGQPVEFAIQMNNRGQPQAVDVMWLPMTAARAEAHEKRQNTREEPTSNQWHIGTLKSFSASQGYGFISCEDLQRTHSRDVYFDQRNLPKDGEWMMGQTVEFQVVYNYKGQPQARSINWSPVPFVQKADGQAPPSRTIDQNDIQNLSKILTHLNDGNTIAATEIVNGLQKDSNLIDYQKFLEDRMKEPSRVISK